MNGNLTGRIGFGRLPGSPLATVTTAGFTLVELVIIIVVLGILAAVAIPKFAGISDSSKETATRKEMLEIKRAIIGNPEIVAGGRLVYPGFEGDIGSLPDELDDLAHKPGSLLTYNRLTRLGWNGPYIDSAGGEFLTDAWGMAYVYDRTNRRIMSVGGGDTLITSF